MIQVKVDPLAMEKSENAIGKRITIAQVKDATKWAKYNDYQGPVYRGTVNYNPNQPWSAWDRIVGCIARCEGTHDTVVMYDGTGVTWGFMQWTFTSGRLQKVFQSLKSIPYSDSPNETLFSMFCMSEGKQVFEKFGFKIESGNFVDISNGKILDPNNKAQKKRIVDICLGKVAHSTFADQKNFAISLCAECAAIAKCPGVAEAQVSYSKEELKRALTPTRSPLGNYGTIGDLLGNTLDTAVAGIFFNLWQNNPGAAYKLFINARNSLGSSYSSEEYLNKVWKLLNNSTFGNWSYKAPQYLKSKGTPRIVRVKSAVKEFYGLDLTVIK